MAESVIQIKSGIMINVRASVKNINVKKTIFRILIHVLAKMIKIYQALFSIQGLCVMKL